MHRLSISLLHPFYLLNLLANFTNFFTNFRFQRVVYDKKKERLH